ncbi:hypothetical protein PI125_g24488 [Phytophthora idaei]|nr:hypothetical protein PI125_g24488 [Phytophthora idaei]
MFLVPSHAAASSSVPASAHSPASLSDPSPRERATPSRQSSQRSQFKSSLLAEHESASDSDVLGLESEVVESSSGDEGSRSPAVPSSGDVEEKTEDVTVDSPVQEVPSSQPSGRVLSLTPGSGPVIRLSSEASLPFQCRVKRRFRHPATLQLLPRRTLDPAWSLCRHSLLGSTLAAPFRRQTFRCLSTVSSPSCARLRIFRRLPTRSSTSGSTRELLSTAGSRSSARVLRCRLVVKPSPHAASRASSPSLTSLTPTTHSRPTCDRCPTVQAS